MLLYFKHNINYVLSAMNAVSSFSVTVYFYPAALKGSGVLSYPERAGGRQGRQAPLTLSRP